MNSRSGRATAKAVEDRFNEVLLKAVDDGLAMLGETVRHAIYYHVERSSRIKREEIPERLETFHRALEDLLRAGGNVVEKMIARSLYGKLGLDFEEHENWTLVDYVSYTKKAKGS